MLELGIVQRIRNHLSENIAQSPRQRGRRQEDARVVRELLLVLGGGSMSVCVHEGIRPGREDGIKNQRPTEKRH